MSSNQSDWELTYTQKAVNSLKSQSFGRRVYCIENGDQKYWLKLQLAQINTEYERGFLNELEIYSQLNYLESSDEQILWNFSILDLNDSDQNSEVYLPQLLRVTHADALFEKNPFKITFEEVVRTLHHSLTVLENLHQLEFIHGDLKIEHFRITNYGAVLIDFEQTCHISKLQNMPNTATPRYMAPELFHAEVKSYASDIYALGIIWLEWLNQKRLANKSYIDWAKLHCQSLKVQLPADFSSLTEILTSMLIKNKLHRCSNIYQLKQVLSRID